MSPASDFAAQLAQVKARCADLESAVEGLRGENANLRDRFVEVESRYVSLTSRFVAICQMHGARDRGQVLERMHEVVANLVGCEEFAIFLTSAAGVLGLERAMGVEPDAMEALLRDDSIAECVRSAQPRFGFDADDRHVTACLPIGCKGEVVGLLLLFSLLPQKQVLQPSDRELLVLMCDHAATAVLSADALAMSAAGTPRTGDPS